jgi:hypothetical protein
MNITLPLPPDTQAELERRAANAGIDVPTFVLEAIKDTLDDQTESAAGELPYDQWHAEFRAWISSHVSRNPNFDDSRDSIYA